MNSSILYTNDTAQIQKLFNQVESQHPTIAFMSITGSVAAGTDTELSDIDIGGIFNDDPKSYIYPGVTKKDSVKITGIENVEGTLWSGDHFLSLLSRGSVTVLDICFSPFKFAPQDNTDEQNILMEAIRLSPKLICDTTYMSANGLYYSLIDKLVACKDEERKGKLIAQACRYLDTKIQLRNKQIYTLPIQSKKLKSIALEAKDAFSDKDEMFNQLRAIEENYRNSAVSRINFPGCTEAKTSLLEDIIPRYKLSRIRKLYEKYIPKDT